MGKTRAKTKCNDKGKGRDKVKDKYQAMVARAGKSRKALTRAMTRAMTSADNAMTRAMTDNAMTRAMTRADNDKVKSKGHAMVIDNRKHKVKGTSRGARCMAALNPKGQFIVADYGTDLAAVHGTSNRTAMVLVSGRGMSCASGNDVDDFINDTTHIDKIYGGDEKAWREAFDQTGKDEGKSKVSKVGGKGKDQVKGNDRVTSRRFFVRHVVEPPHVATRPDL